MNHRCAWSVAVTCVLLSVGPQVLFAGPDALADKPRVQLCGGLGGSSASRPNPDLLVSAHPGVGWRLGFLVVPPRTERLGYDFGMMFDVRTVAIRREYPAWSLPSWRIKDEHVVTSSSVVFPIRLRISGAGTTVRPYAAIGPELSVLLTAREGNRSADGSREALSLNVSGALGVERTVTAHAVFFELGSSCGVNGIGSYTGEPHRSSFGLGEAKSIVLFVAAGLEL